MPTDIIDGRVFNKCTHSLLLKLVENTSKTILRYDGTKCKVKSKCYAIYYGKGRITYPMTIRECYNRLKYELTKGEYNYV